MNLNALKHAVELTKAKREIFRTSSLSRLREAVRIAGRTSQDDKQIFRLQKQLDFEIAAHKAALEELAAMKAQLNDDLSKIKADTTLIVKDVKERKKRRGIVSRTTPRATADDNLWNRGAFFRAMRDRIKKGEKQIAAAAAVKATVNKKDELCTLPDETLARQYRAWEKKLKEKRAD